MAHSERYLRIRAEFLDQAVSVLGEELFAKLENIASTSHKNGVRGKNIRKECILQLLETVEEKKKRIVLKYYRKIREAKRGKLKGVGAWKDPETGDLVMRDGVLLKVIEDSGRVLIRNNTTGLLEPETQEKR